jgi:glycerophosphoryl diester phosphodiesterase
MKIISHRGLLTGPDSKIENTWDAIFYAAAKDYSVEFDVWYDKEKEGFFLGHDGPHGEQMTLKEVLEFDQHTNVEFFVHCKSLETLSWMQFVRPFSPLLHKGIHVFYHDIDDCVAIENYTWVHPKAVKNSAGIDTVNITRMIYVLPNFGANHDDLLELRSFRGCAGICTDYPVRLENMEAKL